MSSNQESTSAHKGSSQRLHGILQTVGSVSAAILAFGAISMLITTLAVADFNVDVAIVLLSGATPTKFLQWVALVIISNSLMLSMAISALLIARQFQYTHDYIPIPNSIRYTRQRKISENGQKVAYNWRTILFAIAIFVIGMLICYLIELRWDWLVLAAVGLTIFLLIAFFDPEFYLILKWSAIITFTLTFFMVILDKGYWGPHEIMRWDDTDHTVQLVTTEGDELIILAPKENRIYRLNKKMVQSREYCLAHEPDPVVTFDLPLCP